MTLDIAALRALGEAATPPPWDTIVSSGAIRYLGPDVGEHLHGDFVSRHGGIHLDADNEFVAAARNAWAELLDAAEERGLAEQKWRLYENEFILPCFEMAESVGIDLRRLVKENPGKNCVALLVGKLMAENAELRRRLEELHRDFSKSVESREGR